jgi:integral membrane sensor domain MASE1
MLCVSLATGLAGAMAEGNLIWVANGVLLAYLLLAPRRLWPAYLCAQACWATQSAPSRFMLPGRST